jgi:hypothetical protein
MMVKASANVGGGCGDSGGGGGSYNKDNDNEDWALWDENVRDFYMISFCVLSGYKPP